MSENHFLASDVEQHYRALLEAERKTAVDLMRENERIQAKLESSEFERETAYMALRLASKAFAAGDMESVRRYVCDINAFANVRNAMEGEAVGLTIRDEDKE